MRHDFVLQFTTAFEAKSFPLYFSKTIYRKITHYLLFFSKGGFKTNTCSSSYYIISSFLFLFFHSLLHSFSFSLSLSHFSLYFSSLYFVKHLAGEFIQFLLRDYFSNKSYHTNFIISSTGTL